MSVDWTSRKMPVYCRPHGQRLVAFINGVGMCENCILAYVEQIEAGMTEDERRAYRAGFEEPDEIY